MLFPHSVILHGNATRYIVYVAVWLKNSLILKNTFLLGRMNRKKQQKRRSQKCITYTNNENALCYMGIKMKHLRAVFWDCTKKSTMTLGNL